MLTRFIRHSVFLLAVLASSSCLLQSQQTPQVLLSANQGSADVTLTDLATRKILTRIPEAAPAGHEVAVSPDGRYAYVPIYGDSSVGEPGTDGSTILIIDLKTHNVAGQIDLQGGVRPHGIVFNRKDGYLYVTAELQQSVLVIDPRSRTIVGRIPTGQAQTHMIVLSHDGRIGYTSNVGPGSVSVLDLRSRKLLRVIPVSSGGVQRISITPDDRTVITADQGRARLALIDTRTLTVRSWIPLPSTGYGTAVSLDNKKILVTLPKLNELGVIDLPQGVLSKTFAVAKRPHTVVLADDGKTAYVACIDTGVSAVDLVNGSVSEPIIVGNHSDGIALSYASEGSR